jgi:hypothetical protein
MRLLAALTFLLAQPAGWKPPAVRIQDEGSLQGYASTLNCVGAGISCSVGASVATLSVPGGGGGGGSPGGSSGNVQINSAGAFGAYTGTTCAYAVKSLDANGAATCTAAPSIPFPAGSASELQIRASGTAFGAYTGTGACAAGSYMTALDAFGAKTCTTVPYAQVTGTPTIPADVSGASYWTRVAEPGLSNETALGALGTGIVLNTTTTGVPTIYTGTSCTNQFPRSLNASGAATCASVAAATDVTGTLPVANGGTNSTATPTNGGVGYGTGTAHAYTAAGTSGQVLTSNGAAAPTWQTAAGGSGPAKLCGFRFASAAATSGAVTCAAAQVFYCLVNVTGYGGSDVVSFRFNADTTATNYHARWILFSNAATPVVTSANFTTGGNIQLGPTTITTGRSILLGCSNDATHRKICSIQEQEEATAQATFAQMSTGYGEWFNTTAQITSIEMRTNGGQTLTAGSGFVCYGGTPP